MSVTFQADVIVIGAGIAGLTTALELLEAGKRVLLLDAAPREAFGGLARWSFGGFFLVDTPEQRRGGIEDSIELALEDWQRFAAFDPTDVIPRQWAERYVSRCSPDVGDWLRGLGIWFIPAVHWTERGVDVPGNSVARFHITWGTGKRIVDVLGDRLQTHERTRRLTMRFQHRVTDLERVGGRLVGCQGTDAHGQPFRATATEALVVASGGFAGNLERVRQHWPSQLEPAPEDLLSGSHPYADGAVMNRVQAAGGRVTHLDRMWHYGNGVKHWRPHHPDHGLQLAVPRSALWVGYDGRRLGPEPLMFNFDSGYVLRAVCAQPKPVSWAVLNTHIARKELAISGAEFNPAIRDRNWVAFLWGLAFGKRALVQQMIDHSEDTVVAASIGELAHQMNARTGTNDVDPAALQDAVARFDASVQGSRDDPQLQRLDATLSHPGDRARTLKRAPIDDPRSRPLLAIRQRVMTRKSLGGIQTDLESRVLDEHGSPIAGLYAVGEAAGFGGGNLHGHRSLEGTFLGACILTGRIAARAIAGGAL